MKTSIVINKFSKLLLSKKEQITFSNAKERLISEDSNVAPVHIAYEGTFSGYRDGEFSLTSDMFDKVIENFNNEKTPLAVYKGHADVMNTSPEEIQNHGWILGLEKDSKGNLWALVEFTKELANQIKEGMYKFSSIYLQGNAIDRVTGEEIGPRLCSLAITANPFLDGLMPITLSNKNESQYNIYLSKELQAMKKKTDKVILADMKKEEDMTDAMCAQTEPPMDSAEGIAKSVEDMGNMQKGKTIEAVDGEPMDPMQMIEDVKSAVSPEMTTEDFIKHLLDLFKSELAEANAEKMEEQAVGAEADTQIMEESTLVAQTNPEMIQKDQKEEEKKPEAIAASNSVALTGTIKSLNLALSQANSEIMSLKNELKKRDEVMLTAIVDDAVAKGKLTDIEKPSFVKLGMVDRGLFDELLKARNHKPSIVLGRVTAQSDNDIDHSTVSGTKRVRSAIELKILEGAGIKVK